MDLIYDGKIAGDTLSMLTAIVMQGTLFQKEIANLFSPKQGKLLQGIHNIPPALGHLGGGGGGGRREESRERKPVSKISPLRFLL